MPTKHACMNGCLQKSNLPILVSRPPPKVTRVALVSAPESHSGGENWSGEALRVRGVSWWKDGAAAAAAVG